MTSPYSMRRSSTATPISSPACSPVTPRLAQVLADEFTIIDVASGRLVVRDEFLGAVEAGDVHFTGIDRDAAQISICHRPGVAVVIGLIRMTMTVGPAEIAVHSRYTHVYERAVRGWPLLAAQGTPLTRPAPAR
jgi:ketosteroid isomerase-like protein